MSILRFHIYQAQAHYRIPFTYQRRHTYPIPPYSTVIGFLCNVCGVDDQNNSLYQIIKNLKISIAGKFSLKNTEMIWYRNLSKKAHEGSYGSISVREKNGNIGHVGGQSPMYVDVLEDVEILVYLFHQEKEKLDLLKKHLVNPVNRLQVLHIGRSEDWIVYKSEPKILDEENDLVIKRKDANYGYFLWIPKSIYRINNAPEIDFNKVDGNLYRLTTYSKIDGYDTHHNHTGRRIYNYIEAKLSDGKIFGYNLLLDREFNLPIFLGEIK